MPGEETNGIFRLIKSGEKFLKQPVLKSEIVQAIYYFIASVGTNYCKPENVRAIFDNLRKESIVPEFGAAAYPKRWKIIEDRRVENSESIFKHIEDLENQSGQPLWWTNWCKEFINVSTKIDFFIALESPVSAATINKLIAKLISQGITEEQAYTLFVATTSEGLTLLETTKYLSWEEKKEKFIELAAKLNNWQVLYPAFLYEAAGVLSENTEKEYLNDAERVNLKPSIFKKESGESISWQELIKEKKFQVACSTYDNFSRQEIKDKSIWETILDVNWKKHSSKNSNKIWSYFCVEQHLREEIAACLYVLPENLHERDLQKIILLYPKEWVNEDSGKQYPHPLFYFFQNYPKTEKVVNFFIVEKPVASPPMAKKIFSQQASKLTNSHPQQDNIPKLSVNAPLPSIPKRSVSANSFYTISAALSNPPGKKPSSLPTYLTHRMSPEPKEVDESQMSTINSDPILESKMRELNIAILRAHVYDDLYLKHQEYTKHLESSLKKSGKPSPASKASTLVHDFN